MSKKKKLIIGAIIIIILILFFMSQMSGGATSTAYPVETVTAETRDLTSYISATGMVESQNSRGIYSTLTNQVETVNVKVGDQVNADDILAQLDTASLELQVAQQKASINAQAAVTGQQVNAATQNLENARFTDDAGLNSQIISAQANVDSAYYAMRLAEEDLKSAKDSRSSAVRTVTNTYDQQVLADGYSGSIAGNYTGGSASTGSSTDALDNAVHKAEISVASTRSSWENAKRSLEAVLNAANINIDTYEQQLAAAKASHNYSAQQIQLQIYQKNVTDATITAPVSGTVTAVYAEEGAAGSGLLFMVEDIESLKIETKVKEFDVLSVVPGQKVIIKSDSTGNDEYEGVVESVDPTAIKSSTGTTAAQTAGGTTTTSEFGVTVNVTSPSTRLKVGMNTRLSIVTDEKTKVQSVPAGSITTSADGSDAIFLAKQNEQGKWIATLTPVTLGLETDYYIEISSPKLTNTDYIISNIDGIVEGMEVLPSNIATTEPVGSGIEETSTETNQAELSSTSITAEDSQEPVEDENSTQSTTTPKEESLPAENTEEEVSSAGGVE